MYHMIVFPYTYFDAFWIRIYHDEQRRRTNGWFKVIICSISITYLL